MTFATHPELPRGKTRPTSALVPPPEDAPVYSAAFWIAYVANVALVTANALTFRFAELIDFLGGKEQTAGIVIGVATAVALFSRVSLGQAIDRYGVRNLWIGASVLFVLGGLLLTTADSLSPQLFLARSLFAVGLAGMFTCSTVHIQGLVPAHRRTEAIGSLGSSGFVGMILGSLLGDTILQNLSGATQFTVLFGCSTTLGVLYLLVIFYLTRNDRHERPVHTPAIHHLAIRYWPGNVILVAFVVGLMLAVTTVFLTRFATHRGLHGLGPFFLSYAGSAFTFRLISRNWSRTVGRHRMIFLGLAGHIVAMLLLPFVTSEWLFAIPAAFGGFGHALLFPAVVSMGSESFPREYRGTGTTIVMGFFDVGTFVSAPILGTIIDTFDRTGFTPMFLTAAAVAIVVAVIYALTSARTFDSDFAPETSASHSRRGETLARRPFLPRHSPIEPFAREMLSGERPCSLDSAREPSATDPLPSESNPTQAFASEASSPQSFAPQVSASGSSARQESADGRSAREGCAGQSPSVPKTSRPAAILPATRCR